MKQINYLMEFGSKYPDIYNFVSNKLYTEFKIQSAELSLLCTFIAKEYLDYEHREGNRKSDKKVGAGAKSKAYHPAGDGENNRSQ